MLQLFPQLQRLHSEASGSSRMLCKNLSSNFCFHGRRWCYRCTVCAHDFTSERFLLIRAFYHIYFTVKVKVGTSHGKGSTPLTAPVSVSYRHADYTMPLASRIHSDKLRKYFFISEIRKNFFELNLFLNILLHIQHVHYKNLLILNINYPLFF